MADEKNWLDRLFGSGIVFSTLSACVALWGLYAANSKENDLRVQKAEQKIILDEFKDKLGVTEKIMKDLRDRLVTVEASVSLAKSETHQVAMNTALSGFRSIYTTPAELNQLRLFGQKYTEQQKTWADVIRELPKATASTSGTLSLSGTSTVFPPPPTLPSSLSFLNGSDKSQVESILQQTAQNWNPTLKVPGSPSLEMFNKNIFTFPTEPELSFPEKIWNTLKAYPGFVILLALIVLGSAMKK